MGRQAVRGYSAQRRPNPPGRRSYCKRTGNIPNYRCGRFLHLWPEHVPGRHLPRKLEQMLNQNVGSPRTQVLDRGANGSSTENEVQIVRNVRRERPNFLVLQVTLDKKKAAIGDDGDLFYWLPNGGDLNPPMISLYPVRPDSFELSARQKIS